MIPLQRQRDIDALRIALEASSTSLVTEYIHELTARCASDLGYEDYKTEGLAALVLSRHGFKVELSDKPDLRLQFNHTALGAEVTRFRRKEQDEIDDERLKQASDRLQVYGVISESDGRSAWEQLCIKIRNKCSQLLEGQPNILIVRSSSEHCVGEDEVKTAVNELSELDQHVERSHTQRLNGVLFFSPWRSCGSDPRSVHFFECLHPAVQISVEIRETLRNIRTWNYGF